MFFTRVRIEEFWPGKPLHVREWQDLYLLVRIAGTLVVTGRWFIFTQRWAERESVERRANRNAFYSRLADPIESSPEAVHDCAKHQYTYLGWLGMLWAAAVVAMALMLNSRTVHLTFSSISAFCGLIAALLLIQSRRLRNRERNAA